MGRPIDGSIPLRVRLRMFWWSHGGRHLFLARCRLHDLIWGPPDGTVYFAPREVVEEAPPAPANVECVRQSPASPPRNEPAGHVIRGLWKFSPPHAVDEHFRLRRFLTRN